MEKLKEFLGIKLYILIAFSTKIKWIGDWNGVFVVSSVSLFPQSEHLQIYEIYYKYANIY